MEYKRFNNTIIIRIDKGEEVLEKLKELSIKENIKLASVTGIGATDHFIVGVYSVNEKKYYKHEFTGVYEITSLIGSINTKNGEHYSHLHITCADEKCHSFGGHLNELRISATSEITINIIDGEVDRMIDDVTGLNIYKF